MKQKQHKQASWLYKNWIINIGLMSLCAGCMVNIPLPSSSNPAAKVQNQSEADLYDDDCALDVALEKSMKENLSPERDVGVSGFAFSRLTEAVSMADPTGTLGAARTGYGLYQTGKVAADTHKNRIDCGNRKKDSSQNEIDSNSSRE